MWRVIEPVQVTQPRDMKILHRDGGELAVVPIRMWVRAATRVIKSVATLTLFFNIFPLVLSERGSWAPREMVQFDEKVPNTFYGSTLDFSSYFLAVGARLEGTSGVVDDDEIMSYSGNVYLYTTKKGRWVEQDSIRNVASSGLCQYLGTTVAVSNVALAAACGTENDLTAPSTSIFMFALSQGDEGFVRNTPPERLEIPDDLNDPDLRQFGSSLALSDDTLVVGIESESLFSPPVLVYTYHPLLGTWGPNPTQRFAAGIHFGFGCSLGIAGNHVVVGTKSDAVAFFRRNSSGEPYHNVRNVPGIPRTGFGRIVAVSEKYCFIGFIGETHIYIKKDGDYGETYYHWQDYTSPRGTGCGSYGLGPAAVTDNHFIVTDNDLGEVYVYDIVDTGTGYGGLPVATYRDDYANDFGYDVALTDRYAAIGAISPGGVLIYPNLVSASPCTPGYGLIKGNADLGICQLCAPGTFSAGGGDSCEECAVYEYSDAVDYVGAHSCDTCPYGRVSAWIGSGADTSKEGSYTNAKDKCTGRDHDYYDYAVEESLECDCSFYGLVGIFGVKIAGVVIAMASLLVVAFLSSSWYLVKIERVDVGYKNRAWLLIQLVQLMLLPILDIISDLLYLLLAVWATETIFILGILTLILPMFAFLDLLYRAKWYPKFWLGAPPRSVYPYDDLDTLWKVSVTLLTTLPWVLLNLPVLLVLTVGGYVLYSSKLLAIRPLRNLWLQLLTGTDKFDIVEPIDLSILKESLYSELWIETIPQLILQSINNTLMQQWSEVALFSTTVSSLIILNALYRVWYYAYRGFSTEAIPTDLEWYVELQCPNAPKATVEIGVLGILKRKLGWGKTAQLEGKLKNIELELSKKEIELQRVIDAVAEDVHGCISHATNPIHVLSVKSKSVDSDDDDDENHTVNGGYDGVDSASER